MDKPNDKVTIELTREEIVLLDALLAAKLKYPGIMSKEGIDLIESIRLKCNNALAKEFKEQQLKK